MCSICITIALLQANTEILPVGFAQVKCQHIQLWSYCPFNGTFIPALSHPPSSLLTVFPAAQVKYVALYQQCRTLVFLGLFFLTVKCSGSKEWKAQGVKEKGKKDTRVRILASTS